MATLILFVFGVLNALINVLVFAVVASAILSWLVAFDVINLRNPLVNQVVRFLDAITRPILRPFQRIIPPLGGVDISPVVALIIITVAQSTLLPGLRNWLLGLVGG
ncbi:MAG TPA: YggT family protein [Phenylobacterium sp.]|jgi:YggT family protein|uniref:YggT family protein n=1 Tax=Phenylobacterium conjunctum TaxID=1298959 RepID=A0ABW3T4T0_9CAUL|nr:YggT family protein [Phenylobacterium sp.]HQN49816.1 YggT family protein [Phenylobacterium sp.]HQP19613.1 YggT family protein [Phenylobacterium sp.]